MTIWISCYRLSAKVNWYELHVSEPSWVQDDRFVKGGFWDSSSSVELSRDDVSTTMGKETPGPGELLECELNHRTTWVME